MAQLVMAACSSHAPMMLAARDSAPEAQRVAFFEALARLRTEIHTLDVTAMVVVSNEHFTNFFLDNFPQLCVGIGESCFGPVEPWLGVPQRQWPGRPVLAESLLGSLVHGGVDAAFSSRLSLDHGIVSVAAELMGERDIPVVPIIQNCAVTPLSPLARAVEVGRVLRDAIEAAPTDDRVALIGAGGLSHWVGPPRVGDIDEDFDRWVLSHLASGDVDVITALSDAQVNEAGNGAHEIRSWLTVAGAAGAGGAELRGEVLAYEAIHSWITGMGVIRFDLADQGAIR